VLTTAVALLAASLKNAALLQKLHEHGLRDDAGRGFSPATRRG
jgi:hypothetical protein